MPLRRRDVDTTTPKFLRQICRRRRGDTRRGTGDGDAARIDFDARRSSPSTPTRKVELYSVCRKAMAAAGLGGPERVAIVQSDTHLKS